MHFSWIECFVKICLVWSGFVELCKYQFHKLKRFVSQLVFTAAVCSVFNHLSIFCFTFTYKYLFSLLFSKRNTMLLRIKMFLCFMQWGFEKNGNEKFKSVGWAKRIVEHFELNYSNTYTYFCTNKKLPLIISAHNCNLVLPKN